MYCNTCEKKELYGSTSDKAAMRKRKAPHARPPARPFVCLNPPASRELPVFLTNALLVPQVS